VEYVEDFEESDLSDIEDFEQEDDEVEKDIETFKTRTFGKKAKVEIEYEIEEEPRKRLKTT
jgi:protein MAK16